MNETTTQRHDVLDGSRQKPEYLLGFGLACTTWTIFANIIVLVCFYINRRKEWTSFSRQACSISVSDFLIGCLFLQLFLVNRFGTLSTGYLCLPTIFLILAIQCVSLFHVLGICVYRNLILNNMSTNENTVKYKRFIKNMIVASWILPSFIMAVPCFIFYNFDIDSPSCSPTKMFGSNVPKASIYTAIFYGLSQILTNVIYAITAFRVWRLSRRIIPIQSMELDINSSPSTSRQHTRSPSLQNRTNVTTTSPSSSMVNRHKAILFTIGIIMVLFDVFTLPATILMFDTSFSLGQQLRFTSHMMFVINSGINPIVHVVRINTLKKSVIGLFSDIYSWFSS